MGFALTECCMQWVLHSRSGFTIPRATGSTGRAGRTGCAGGKIFGRRHDLITSDMPSRSVVLVVVLVLGYSLYGGLFLAAGAVHESLASDGPGRTNASIDGGIGDGTGPGDRTGEAFGAKPFRFAEVDAGLNYTFTGSEDIVTYQAGVFAADYNSDGWSDVLAIGGRRPVLFENVRGSFEPAGALPPIEGGQVQGALWVDYDVDGRPDLLVLSEDAPPLLLENTGGSFEKRPSVFERSLNNSIGATTADYNRDGCPDLFVYQNGDWTRRLPLGNKNFSAPVNDDNGNPDVLYRGTCSGFERVSDAGIRGTRWTLAASFVDLTGDGYPDIHETNDFNHDIVYTNRGNGSFEQVVLPERTNRNGMSSEIADVTLDGQLDIYVTNIFLPTLVARQLTPGLALKANGNNLITRLHGDTFVERARQYSINRGGWGWAAVITDFDNDADQDLFHTTREMNFDRRDASFNQGQLDLLRSWTFYSYPAVWSRANETTFRRVNPKAAGFTPTNGRGVARLDYDRDGDPDLAVAGSDGYRVFENRMDRGNAIQLRVLGSNGSGTAAHGATVAVTADGHTQTRRVHARTDFVSQDTRLVHVGVGTATRVDVRVVWPDGTTRRFENRSVSQRLVVAPGGIVRSTDFINR